MFVAVEARWLFMMAVGGVGEGAVKLIGEVERTGFEAGVRGGGEVGF